MSSESIRQEVDYELCDRLSDRLKTDGSNALQKWEEQNLLLTPIFQHKLWESAHFLIENGYRLDTPAYLNAPMRDKALPLLWMDNILFYRLLSVSTPAVFNHQDQNGNTILHAVDGFEHHMRLRDADAILNRMTAMMEKGADATIKNKDGERPLKKIEQLAGYAKNHDIRHQFLAILQQQRQHIKE